MEHHGLIFLAVLGFVFLSVDASYQGLKTNPKERSVIYEADKFKCPFVFGTFSDPEDCSHFYICMGGMALRKKCSMFMSFDKWTRRCLPSMIATCGGNNKDKDTTLEPPATESTLSTKSDDNKFSCPSIWGSFPHPVDCSKYYSCKFYRHSLKTCPENQLFDAVNKECKPENEVNCGDRDRPLDLLTTEIPTETETDIATEETTTEEITSTTEEITTEPFPTGPPEHDCNEEDLDCIIDETGDVSNWFICPQDVGSYPHPSSDQLFIFCMNWIPSAKKCGQNLVFSKYLSTCIEIETETEDDL